MFSRRQFILGSLGFVLCPQAALSRRAKNEAKATGIRSICREAWPPAISPDYAAIVDKGYALFSDQSGRLAIVDLKREDGPHVVGELFGIGKKTVDLTCGQHRAYAISLYESGAESQYFLVTISITPASDPTVMSRLPLSYFSEPSCLAASPDVVLVGGVGLNGENQVLVFPVSGKRRLDESVSPLSTLTFDQPVAKLDIQDRQLVVMQASPRTQLDVINLSNPHIPEKIASIKLDGSYSVMSRTRDILAVAGQSLDRKYDIRLIAFRPTPHVVSQALLPVSEVFDASFQKGQFLVLANQMSRQVVVPVSYGKNLDMTVLPPVMLPAGSRGPAAKARIVVKDKDAYVTSDWGGVQVLNIRKGGWQYMYSHTIPRLPASAVAVWGDRAVLAGADLKLYDIANPQKPVLLDATDVGSTVKSLSCVGNRMLCLSRDGLSLRRIEKPGDIGDVLKVSGNYLTYDSTSQKAYVIQSKEKSTSVCPVRVSEQLVEEKSLELPTAFRRAAADGGQLLLAGLNDLALYRMNDAAEPVGSRRFPNLAIRDLFLGKDYAVISAVDQNLRGFLLTLSFKDIGLPTLGSTDLPQDAVALTVAGRTAVVVGRSPEGRDLATVVDLSNPVQPKIAASLPVVEAACAVMIREQMAIIVGRGLEILSLS